MTSHGQCPRGGACECPRGGGGVFQFFGGQMTSRGQCPRGGAPGVPPIQVQTPPHLAGWLRAWTLNALGSILHVDRTQWEQGLCRQTDG